MRKPTERAIDRIRSEQPAPMRPEKRLLVRGDNGWHADSPGPVAARVHRERVELAGRVPVFAQQAVPEDHHEPRHQGRDVVTERVCAVAGQLTEAGAR